MAELRPDERRLRCDLCDEFTKYEYIIVIRDIRYCPTCFKKRFGEGEYYVAARYLLPLWLADQQSLWDADPPDYG